MANDLKEFAKRLRAAGRMIEANSAEMTRKTALAIDATVVMATPVDTGRARANWQVTLGAPAQDDTPSTDVQAALDQGQTVIGGYTADKGSIYIVNNLPYIKRLNEGHSAQAPAGFVEKAVLVGVAAIRGMKIV